METTDRSIQIVGINEAGYESGNTGFVDGRDLPWLQEPAGGNVWSTWSIEYRDVVIVDGSGTVVSVTNLSSSDLGETANYEALRQDLLNAASD